MSVSLNAPSVLVRSSQILFICTSELDFLVDAILKKSALLFATIPPKPTRMLLLKTAFPAATLVPKNA